MNDLRVTILQRTLAKYRVPVFKALNLRPGISVNVMYSHDPGIPNVPPDGFEASQVPMRNFRILGRPVYWQGAQLSEAANRANAAIAVPWDVHYATILPAFWRAKRNGIGTVLWGHGVSKVEARWRRTMREKLARVADAVLFYSRTAYQSYVDAGFPPEKMFVAPNTVDLSEVVAARAVTQADPSIRADFRREHNLGDGPVILFVSRFDPKNQVDVLLEACALVEKQLPTVRCILVGKGADEARIRERVREMKLEHCISMPGAVYDETQLSRYFAAADVYCYPSNMGLSLLHAFGYGLPVITGGDRQLHGPEIVAFEHDVNGLFFKHGDAQALAGTLEKVLTDPGLRDRLADGAYRTATETYTLDKMVDGMEAAIRYAAGVAGR